MKIGVDIRSLMDNRYSGVSWYTYHLLENLLALDQKNQYLLFYNSRKKTTVPEFSQINAFNCGFNYPNKLFNLAVNFFDFPKFDQLIGGVDLFFLPNLHFASWSPNCRRVLVVHDLSFLKFSDFFPWKMRLWQKLVLRKGVIKQADILIADSDNTKEDLVDLLGIPAEKIRVVQLGVSKHYRQLDKADPILAAVRTKYNLPEKFILYLGNLEPRKNIETIIESFKNIEGDNHLVIAGGLSWKAKLVRTLANQDKRIKLIGYVAEPDKPALYNLAEIFLYPSYYEGFGLPIMEAMACGCPVIAANNSSQLEVVDRAGLLVDPYNQGEIVAAINCLRTDSRFRAQLINQGLERAQQFSWQKTARKTLQIFEQEL